MATTMVPPTGTPRPAAGTPRRVVVIRANLLPDEVVSGRQALVVRKKVLTALGGLVALLVAWYGLSWWQTTSARSDLEDMQHRNSALLSQQNEFRPVVDAQTGASTIQAQLASLMASNVSWNDMLSRLRSVAPGGMSLGGIEASLTTGTQAAAGGTVPAVGANGLRQIGTMTISGTAGDKNAVAAFADKLAQVKGLAAPLISSVDSVGHTVSFSIDLAITSDALGGRYSAPVMTTTTAPTGGK